MIIIENKVAALPTETNYAQLIKACVNVPPKEGFTVDEMRKRIRLIDATENIGDNKSFEVEDADIEVLKPCVKAMRWIILHKDLIEFVDYIMALEKDT